MFKTSFILFLLIVIASCKKDIGYPPCYDVNNPACENYDPCYAISPVKADFNAFMRYSIFSQERFSDSVVFYAASIEATESGANYTWIVDNNDTLYNSPLVYGFGSSMQMSINDTGLHQVKLIVQKQPNSICYPNDDGIDSIIKQLFFKIPRSAYICDYYKGVLSSNPTDSFTIRIAYDDPNLIISQEYTYVYNLNNDNAYYMGAGIWKRQDRKLEVKYNGDSQIGIMGLRAEVNPITRLLTLDFDMESSGSPGTVVETRHFTGKKLN